MSVTWRYAGAADCGLLGEWNHQLIADEGHRNPMDVRQLTERMSAWIVTEYKAVIFSETEAVGYALFKSEPDSIYLRQLFIRREKRRLGLGRQAFAILRSQIWPKDVRLTVEVLCSNVSATAFWRSVGFRDYFLALEIDPAASETSSI